jgi:hypothetical protein
MVVCTYHIRRMPSLFWYQTQHWSGVHGWAWSDCVLGHVMACFNWRSETLLNEGLWAPLSNFLYQKFNETKQITKTVVSTVYRIVCASLHMWEKMVIASNKDISNILGTQNTITHKLCIFYAWYKSYMSTGHS